MNITTWRILDAAALTIVGLDLALGDATTLGWIVVAAGIVLAVDAAHAAWRGH